MNKNFKDFLFDVLYYIGLGIATFIDLIIKVLKLAGKCFLMAILSAFAMFRMVVYSVIKIVMTITTFCFMGGLWLLFLNIKQAVGGVNFFETKYFIPMLWLCGSHLVVSIIFEIVRPKDEDIDEKELRMLEMQEYINSRNLK